MASIAGAIASMAGWSWATLLVAMFLTASALSRYKGSMKAMRFSPISTKDGRRDGWQVVANGGVFVAAAVGSVIAPGAAWIPLGIGAIATSAADTWSTEVGTLSPGSPRSILSGRSVPAGTSGGVSLAGTTAGIAGAACIGLFSLLAGWPMEAFAAATIGGIGGATVDSLLGASVQSRRWCDLCGCGTERPVHSCGAATRHDGGLPWLGNDAVNFLSTLAGACIGLLVSQVTR